MRSPHLRMRKQFSCFFILFGIVAAPADSLEVWLAHANDFLTENEVQDDYYTSAFSLRFLAGGYRVSLEENAFTDSERGLRFDETYVSLGRSLPAWGRWHPEAEAGLLHVGEGLFGERLQNGFHRLIGDEEVELEYVEERELYLTGKLSLRRLREMTPDWRLEPVIEIYGTSGFRHHLKVELRSSWRFHRGLTWIAELGGRYDHVSFDHLEPRVSRAGPMMEVGLEVGNLIAFSWNYNHYGTRMQHVTMTYSWKPTSRVGLHSRQRHPSRRPGG